MKIVTVRRISQVLFFCVFIWFCIVTTVGEAFWQLRGWPVNLILSMDPLAVIGTVLSTHTFYGPLLWALGTVVLTIIFGRFFCGWVCPFGSLHHFVGFLANRKKGAPKKVELNRFRKAQCIKYFVLFFLLGTAAFPTLGTSTLQTGLLDPIPLISRSVNIVIMPVIERFTTTISAAPRFYEGAWAVLAVFFTAVFLNLLIPRFYCRFLCPLGAFFGLISRFAIWRVGKNTSSCSNCRLCEKSCEGGCEPASQIKISECVLCLNCLDDCKDEVISYQLPPSADGEVTDANISRRGFLLSLGTGVFIAPAIRMSGKLGDNWDHRLIRPPGSLAEAEFLKRCIKCGQCMRICPTNVLQPGGIETGLESLWTPILNNRIGTSGCQLNCTACGYVCPTSAIRPITLSEKLGLNEFAETGPVKLGTAFVDRSRCLPWAMDKPCIVCEENCPVSPKAIHTELVFNTVRDGALKVKRVRSTTIETLEGNLPASGYATGDYYCADASRPDDKPRKIIANTVNTIDVSEENPWPILGGIETVLIKVRLQRPCVDIEKCIGCGVCEHECPVSGKRAIRVSGDGETRSSDRKLLL